jgi:hypothetical protein
MFSVLILLQICFRQQISSVTRIVAQKQLLFWIIIRGNLKSISQPFPAAVRGNMCTPGVSESVGMQMHVESELLLGFKM